MVLSHCAITDTGCCVSHHRQCEEASYASCAGTPCHCKFSFTCQWTTNIVPVTFLPSSMTKQSNFEDVLFGLPGRANQTWLVHKTLRGMKVATPSFNWIPLSSTLGHGVVVLASGQLTHLGYAPGHSFLASVDGSMLSSLGSSCLRSTSSLPQRASSTSSL